MEQRRHGKGESRRRDDCHLHLANKCKFSFLKRASNKKKTGLNENRNETPDRAPVLI